MITQKTTFNTGEVNLNQFASEFSAILHNTEVFIAAHVGPHDYPLPVLVEVTNLSNRLEEVLVAFRQKLITLAVRPNGTDPTNLTKAISHIVGGAVDCAKFEQEVIAALDAGLRFTHSQQTQFESLCPALTTIFRQSDKVPRL